MNKDTLIDLYWILDAVQKGTEPNPQHVGACFVAVRDALLRPDNADVVAHIYEALEQTQATADVLTGQLLGKSRQRPLPEPQLIEALNRLLAEQRLPLTLPPELAVAFGRLVEAAHGIDDKR